MPFVSLLWYEKLVDRVRQAAKKADAKPIAAVFERRETIWHQSGKPIFAAGEWSTKTQPLYYAPAHWCVAWPKPLLGRYDAGFDFMVVPRNWQFRCDIDTEDDWKMAEALAATYSHT